MLIAALTLCASGTPAHAQVQPEVRRVALVYELDLPPLFTAAGEVADTAAFHVDTFLRRVRALETDASDVSYALSLRGVACDELRLIGSPTARRALQALRRLARTHGFVRTTYPEERLDDLESDTIETSIRRGDAAIERCIGSPPRGPMHPPQASVATSGAAAGLRRAGVTSVLSAFAVPPTEPRPTVVPAIVIDADGDVPDLVFARPEASAIAVIVDAERLPLLTELAADERIETVNVSALSDLDVIGGVIDPPTEVPASHQAAMVRARAELELFRSYTLDDNPLTPIYSTVAARASSMGTWERPADATKHARALAETLTDTRERVRVSDSAITFTSRSGAVPVTVSNTNDFPVRVRIELETAKMSFERADQTVEVEPPGDTITFEATALATGTFPVPIVVSDPQELFTFATAKVDVRSAAANLSAVVLTAGGALFLVYWLITRLRRRRRAAT